MHYDDNQNQVTQRYLGGSGHALFKDDANVRLHQRFWRSTVYVPQGYARNTPYIIRHGLMFDERDRENTRKNQTE
jgi:hypothetical protein